MADLGFISKLKLPSQDIVKLKNFGSLKNNDGSLLYNGSADVVLSAASVGLNNVANLNQAKAIKSITRSGTTFTYTCLDGTTGTFSQQDNNTTYAAGTGLTLSGTTFSNAGVLSIAGKTGTVTLADLGLSNVMHFKGTTTTELSDGTTTATVIIGGSSYTPSTGDVVLHGDSEFVWTGSAWERLGRDSSFKITQTAVDSGAAATNKWVSRIQQDANGNVAVTMGTLDTSGTWSGNAATATNATNHIANKNNPHAVTASQIGAATSGHTHAGTYIEYNDKLQTTNPFGGKKLYISKIDNAYYAAGKRWTVTGSCTGQTTKTFTASELNNLFDGSYETNMIIPAGSVATIRITFDTERNNCFPGYPYGDTFISYYYAYTPSVATTVNVYCNFEQHGIGIHNFASHAYVGKYATSGASAGTPGLIEVAHNGYYNISYIEYIITAQSTYDCYVTQIEMCLDRPDSSRTPFLSKYAAETLYYNLTAPTFIGALNGNAATATKLATARTISLTGSITGSGSFDGSGNLSIATTTNHTHSYAGSSSAGGSATSAVKLDSSAGSTTQPIYFSEGKPVAITGSIANSTTGNAATATKFASSQSVTLTGDVTGSASSQAGWSVATTLAASGVTAGSYGPSANASPAHSGTFSVPYFTVDAKGRVTAASTKTITLPAIYSLPTATNTTLGGIKPWYSHTVASTGPTTGSNATAVAVNAITTTSGRYYAVETDNAGRAFVNVPWISVEQSGIEDSFKTIQEPVTTPLASGTATSFIDTISQDTNGVITVTKKNIQQASATAAGVVSTSDQTFAGQKTFKDGISISSNKFLKYPLGLNEKVPVWRIGVISSTSAPSNLVFQGSTDNSTWNTAFKVNDALTLEVNTAIIPGNSDATIGGSQNKWSAIYADNFYGLAQKATADESGNNIKSNYVASASISGNIITLKNKNGTSLSTVTLPEVTVVNSIATNGAAGLIKPWYNHTAASTGPTAGSNATSIAVNAISTTSGRYYALEMDSNGRGFVNVPWTDTNTTYSFSNNAATLAWGTTSTIATVGGVDITVTMPANPNTNTTYSAGAGISLSGTTFSNSGVRSIATGSANGTISVNTNGTSADVAIKGLGSAAYTASTAYAAASHNQASNTITAMTGYSKASAAAAVAATDSLNTAIGKLEKALDGKQASGTYLTASSTLDATKLSGTIPAACYTNTTYSAGTGISLSGTTFSLASGVVTAGTAGTSSATSGTSITIPYVTADTYGRVTGYGTHTHTIDLLNLIYPVGSIYMSLNATEPSVLFGGTWERIADKFLFGAPSFLDVGTSGGVKQVTLTTDQLPAHTHGSKTLEGTFTLGETIPYRAGTSVNWNTWQNYSGIVSSNGNYKNNFYYASTTNKTGYTGNDTLKINATHEHNSVGNGNAHDNMPPFLMVNIWRRTA